VEVVVVGSPEVTMTREVVVVDWVGEVVVVG
jgi:hypothetical protein